jgi:hypothetical protein
LFEHLLSNLNFNCATSSLSTKIVTPDPFQCKLLLPTLYAWVVFFLYSLVFIILIASAACGQFLSSTSLSNQCVCLPFPFLTTYF